MSAADERARNPTGRLPGLHEGTIMTTAVKVDAHAGWPVLVIIKYGEPSQGKSVTTERVEPNTERTFYIHSGQQIIGIEECPRPTGT